VRLLAIDPGPVSSSFVLFDGTAILNKGEAPNEDMRKLVLRYSRSEFTDERTDACVIEKVASMGMAVGEEVFETVYWSGIFAEAFCLANVHRVTRGQVKLFLCGSMRARDANIRWALIDKFGGRQAIKKGGPLYKVATHQWSALAVAVTYLGLQKDQYSKEELAS